MITPLSIVSLDQGKFYRAEPPVSDEVDLDAIAMRYFSRTGVTSGRALPLVSAAAFCAFADLSRFVFKVLRGRWSGVTISNAVEGGS